MHAAATDFVAMGWGDCQLWGYTWHNDGKDLWLDVSHASGKRGTIQCSWVGGFKIDIHYAADRGGPTLSRNVDFTESDGRWTVRWDFASDGLMQYTCQDIMFLGADAATLRR